MNLSPCHSRSSGIAAPLLIAIVGCTVLAGCLIIPVDYHATGSRHNISMQSTNALYPGVTTREDILLTLGEPDFVSDDGRRFGYFWTKVKVIWAVASYGPGAAGEITRSYIIEAAFDENNRVSRVRLLQEWGESITGTLDSEMSR